MKREPRGFDEWSEGVLDGCFGVVLRSLGLNKDVIKRGSLVEGDFFRLLLGLVPMLMRNGEDVGFFLLCVKMADACRTSCRT